MSDLTLEFPIERAAVLSECGRYRYLLTRRWSDGPIMTVIGLNPSTADATLDDQTIRRCVRFARDSGHGALHMVNRFGWRCTEPANLFLANDPTGPMNRSAVSAAMRAADTVVAAWGATVPQLNPKALAAGGTLNIVTMARDLGIRLQCFGTTFDGSPRHPSRLGNDTTVQPWTP